MIVMRPIREDAVLDSLNAERFSGEIEGYVVMDGAEYHGHMLYKVENDCTQVLECGVENTALIDGAVRACVAAGENAGATRFYVNPDDEKLARWAGIFCKSDKNPVSNDRIFHQCK